MVQFQKERSAYIQNQNIDNRNVVFGTSRWNLNVYQTLKSVYTGESIISRGIIFS